MKRTRKMLKNEIRQCREQLDVQVQTTDHIERERLAIATRCEAALTALDDIAKAVAAARARVITARPNNG